MLACLFRGHGLGVKREPGEGEEAARKWAINCTNDVKLEIVLRIRNADSVKLTSTGP